MALALAISLLPVYHRGYDRVSALLLIPAVTELAGIRKWVAWLYCALVAFWIANDTLMAHVIRRWRYKPQSPVEDVLFCLILLATLLYLRGPKETLKLPISVLSQNENSMEPD